MSGSPGWLPLLAAVCVVLVGPVAGCGVAGLGGPAEQPSRAGAGHRTHAPSRVAGPSTAGAQGPMQFLPATWAIYGHGSIHRPKDAILAAAHLLAGHGAAGNIAAAVHAYNPSWRYVDAVLRYARPLRHDPYALAGYYHRQVICRLASGWVLLPAGYGINPAAQPISLHL